MRISTRAAAAEAGREDARRLLADIATGGAAALSDALGGVILLASENRFDECQARLDAFSEIVAQEIQKAVRIGQMEELIESLRRFGDAQARMLGLAVSDSEGGEL